MENIELNGSLYPVEGKVSEESFMEIGQYGRRIRCQSIYLPFKVSQKLMEKGGEGPNYFRLSPSENWRTKSTLLASLSDEKIKSLEMEALLPPKPDYSDTKEWYAEPGYGPSW
jgi:hypothetical protein